MAGMLWSHKYVTAVRQYEASFYSTYTEHAVLEMVSVHHTSITLLSYHRQRHQPCKRRQITSVTVINLTHARCCLISSVCNTCCSLCILLLGFFAFFPSKNTHIFLKATLECDSWSKWSCSRENTEHYWINLTMAAANKVISKNHCTVSVFTIEVWQRKVL